MGLTLPLAVRLKTAYADRYVTRNLRDLTFRSTAPGGFASATLSFDRPLDTQPSEIDYYATVYVYDKRSGMVAWEGRLEDPGRTAADGEIWSITAVGPAAHAQDRTVPLIYVDQSIGDGWLQAAKTKASIDVGVAADPSVANDMTQAIVVLFRQGMTLATSDGAMWRYYRLIDSGQKIARLSYNAYTTASTVLNAHSAVHVGSTAAATGFVTEVFGAGGGAHPTQTLVVITDFANGANCLDFSSSYTGGGVTLGAEQYAAFQNFYVVALRVDKTGTEITTGYTGGTVLASDVVADLLGRLLTKFDGANATIATTSYAIDSLAYPEGVTADTLLSDLMILEPAFYWAAWESNSAGLNRFEWSSWPTSVRYEATINDGFDSPGSAVDLYNAVRVRYIDSGGSLRQTRRTQTVTALTNAVLTREGLLDLTVSAGRHSLAYAQRAGDQWLAERATPPNAGTLTVARPIRDLVTGAMVQPWEIKPGTLIRVRGVLPRIDALNPTARDGVTIFRVVAVDFQASSATARLELDSYPRTVAAALARLGKRTTR